MVAQLTSPDFLESAKAEILRRDGELSRLHRLTLTETIEIGKLLQGVKAHLGHGKFMDWYRTELRWQSTKVARFIRLAKNAGKIPAEVSPTKASVLISKPTRGNSDSVPHVDDAIEILQRIDGLSEARRILCRASQIIQDKLRKD